MQNLFHITQESKNPFKVKPHWISWYCVGCFAIHAVLVFVKLLRVSFVREWSEAVIILMVKLEKQLSIKTAVTCYSMFQFVLCENILQTTMSPARNEDFEEQPSVFFYQMQLAVQSRKSFSNSFKFQSASFLPQEYRKGTINPSHTCHGY